MFRGSWVRISALYTVCALFTFICCKDCNFCLKKAKINKKSPGTAHFFEKVSLIIISFLRRRRNGYTKATMHQKSNLELAAEKLY